MGRRHAQKLCVASVVTAHIAKRAFLCVTCNTIINCDCVVIAWFISEQGGIFMSSGTYVSDIGCGRKSLVGQICPALRLQNNKKNFYRQLD